MNERGRFYEKFIPEPNSGCWLWLGYTNELGYGRFSYESKWEKAHRASWTIHNGPVPEGMCICHKCDTPGCVNPDHLFLGTHAENMADRDKKGRMPDRSGENSPRAKLTWKDVRAIRESTDSAKNLAPIFGVTDIHIRKIRQGVAWKGAPDAT